MARKVSEEAAAIWVDASTLRAWPGNPRKNAEAIAPVAESIRRFGFGAPIVARLANRVIIAGHTRLEAALLLQMERVPVRFLDVTEEEAHALALADNRLGEIAEWDDEGLLREMRSLASAEVDLSGLGWSGDELAELLAPPSSPASSSSPPASPPPLPGTAKIIHGRSEIVLKGFASESMDSCVCDPPYGLSEGLSDEEARSLLNAWMAGKPWNGRKKGFMGREWDAFVPGPDLWLEVFRVLKPGAHVIAFAGTRTEFWLTLALQLAGFEIRDVGQWFYSSGFPKSLDVSVAIDERLGATREIVGSSRSVPVGHTFAGSVHGGDSGRKEFFETAPSSEKAKRFSGWGTGLKPALEPWVLARKPLGKKGRKARTIADCVLEFGTGAINIDGCRFGPDDPMWLGPNEGHAWNNGETGVHKERAAAWSLGPRETMQTEGQKIGRWPANILAVKKPSRKEREAGCGHLSPTTRGEITGREEDSAGQNHARSGQRRTGEIRNTHPTLKPIRLMAWLSRLVTPPGGTVLDPFAGSGTAGCASIPQGFSYVGIEAHEPYLPIIEARIAYWAKHGFDEITGWDAEEEADEGEEGSDEG